MNKRLNELFGQALDAAVPYTWHNLDHVEVEKVMKVFAELIVQDCAKICEQGTVTQTTSSGAASMIKQHFGIAEHQGWVCSKCGVDRTQKHCPLGHTASITGDCPMTATAQ